MFDLYILSTVMSNVLVVVVVEEGWIKVVRIFTSSTFTDMVLERNILMEHVYPKLKDYCRDRYGIEFQVECP